MKRIKYGFILDNDIPVELYYGDKVKLYAGVTSTGLANIEKGLTISIAYLLTYNDPTKRKLSILNQERRKKNKIYYPKSLIELDEILSNHFVK